MAIAITAPAAAPRPCSTRSPPSTAMFGASALSTDATTCTPVPISSGVRRPNASESGPTMSWPSARPSSVPVSVSWTVGDVVASSSVIVGSAGRYMSMVSGPSAMSAPKISTSRNRSRDDGM